MPDPKLLGGEFAVDSNGAASYSIPLPLPPGIHGLQPSLTLAYNSAAGLGLAGVGWSLQGLGVITRVPRTLGLDGRCAGVSYDAGDGYALDGHRLVVVQAATAGAPESYRTEVESGLLAVPTYASGLAGPASWTVFTKEGQRMEFGTTADSQVSAAEVRAAISSWALRRVTDRYGNYYLVTYAQDAGKNQRPVALDYTYNDTQGVNSGRRVTLAYQDSGCTLPHYVGGVSQLSGKILTSITTSVAGTAVLTWSFAYQPSPATGRPLLTTLQCPTGPVVFEYPPPAPLLGALIEPLAWKTAAAGDFVVAQEGADFIPVDLDGDGLTDFLQVGADSTGQWLQVTALQNQGDKTFEVLFIQTLGHLWAEYRGTTTLDLDGDGVVELIITLSGTGTSSMILLQLVQNGATWSLTAPVFPVRAVTMPAGYQAAYDAADFNKGQFLPIDLEGDGYLDLAVASDQGRSLRVFRSNHAGLDPADLGNVSPWSGRREDGVLLPLDIDGDGRTDLVRVMGQYGTGYLWFEAATNTGAYVVPVGGTPPAGASASTQFVLRPDPTLAAQLNAAQIPYLKGRMLTGDVNGDGLVDLVWVETDGAQFKLSVFINTGAGFRLESSTIAAFTADDLAPAFAGLSASFPQVMENSDGSIARDLTGHPRIGTTTDTDACLNIPAVVAGANTSDWYIDGKNQFVSLSLTMADVDGDGAAELVAFGRANLGASWLPRVISTTGYITYASFIGTEPTAAAYSVMRISGAAPAVLTHGAWGGLATEGGFAPADLHGTGKAGFIFVPPAGATSVGYFSTPFGVPDLPSAIVNELGGRLNLSFLPITDPRVYSRATGARAAELLPDIAGPQFLAGGASTPAALHAPGAWLPHVGGSMGAVRAVGFPKYVVAAYAKDAPLGSGCDVECFYSGARIDAAGRGWLGFDAMRVGEVALGTVRETCFSQHFPYIGRSLATSLQPGAARPAGAAPVKILQGSLLLYGTGAVMPDAETAACQQVWLNRSVDVWSDGDHVCEAKHSVFTYDAWGVNVASAQELTLQFDGPGAAPRTVSAAFKAFVYAYQRVSRTDGTSNATAPASPAAADWADWVVAVCTTAKIFDNGVATPQLLRSRVQSFNPRGAVAVVTEGDAGNPAQVLTYDYDLCGNRIRSTDGFLTSIKTDFDATHTFPARITRPLAADGSVVVETFAYDPAFGGLLTHVDGNGATIEHRYDALGRLQERRGPTPEAPAALVLHARWTYERDSATEESIVNWQQDLVSRRRQFDGWGRTVLEQTTAPDGSPMLAEFGYDSRDNLVSRTYPHAPGVAPTAVEQRQFDAWNRLALATITADGVGTATRYEWPASFICRITTADGATIEQRHGTFGDERVLLARTSGAGADAETTTWSYDALGRTVSVTDPAGVVTATTYDLLGRVTALKVSTAAGVVQSEQTVFTDAARQALRTDAAGRTVLTTFDALGRLQRTVANVPNDPSVVIKAAPPTFPPRPGPAGSFFDQVYPLHQIVTDYVWDGPASANGLGRLRSVAVTSGANTGATASSSRTDYAYDACGNPTDLTIAIAPAGGATESFAFHQTFQPRGELAAVKFPNGASQLNAYDTHGALATISFAAPGGPSAVVASYRWQGLTGREVTLGNQLRESRQADGLGRLASWSLVTGAAAVLESSAISRGPLDDPLSVGPADYRYDQHQRLASARTPVGNFDYGYQRGDRTQVGAAVCAFDGHRLTTWSDPQAGVSRFGYDANGNLTQAAWAGAGGSAATAQTFAYDAYNRLVSADGLAPGVKISCGYDHVGRRLVKSVAHPDPTQDFYRLSVTPGYEVTHFHDGTSQVAVYVMGPDGPVAQWTDGAAPTGFAGRKLLPGLTYLHRDHLGSVTRVSDPGGAIRATLAYTPSGEIVGDDGTAPVRRFFTGHEFDEETGLYYFQARYYHPRLGVFFQPDDRPAGAAASGDVYHRYAYALYRPVTFTDPSGHNIFDIFDTLGNFFHIGSIGSWAHTASSAVNGWLSANWKPITMFAVSVGLVIAGAVVTGLSFGGASMIGGALMGAGINGIVYTATALGKHEDPNFGDWGIQLGIGAATGLICGGAASWANASLEGVTDAFVRLGTQAFYGALGGAAAGFTSKFLNNAANHVNLASGLAESLGIGAAAGAAGAWAGQAFSLGRASAEGAEAAAETASQAGREALPKDGSWWSTIQRLTYSSQTQGVGAGIFKATMKSGSGIALGLGVGDQVRSAL